MKVINAVWEKRNLGVDCNEITIELADTVESISDLLREAETEYTVVKMPVASVDILLYLQTQGYQFIEAMTSCYHGPESANVNRIQKRLIDSLSYEIMNEDDLNYMFSEIKKGLFKTDRIALDPYFSIQQANNRYIGWIGDELEKGAMCYKLKYKEDAVGFFTFKQVNENTYFPFLGAVYEKYEKSGFGIALNYFEIEEGIRRGAKRIHSAFSTNNRGATGVHLSMGYVLQEQSYVLIKHRK